MAKVKASGTVVSSSGVPSTSGKVFRVSESIAAPRRESAKQQVFAAMFAVKGLGVQAAYSFGGKMKISPENSLTFWQDNSAEDADAARIVSLAENCRIAKSILDEVYRLRGPENSLVKANQAEIDSLYSRLNPIMDSVQEDVSWLRGWSDDMGLNFPVPDPRFRTSEENHAE